MMKRSLKLMLFCLFGAVLLAVTGCGAPVSPPLPRIGFEDRRSRPDDFGRSRWNWTEIPRFFQCEPIDSSKGWIAKTAV